MVRRLTGQSWEFPAIKGSMRETHPRLGEVVDSVPHPEWPFLPLKGVLFMLSTPPAPQPVLPNDSPQEMTVSALRRQTHLLVDLIDNPVLLTTLYALLLRVVMRETGGIPLTLLCGGWRASHHEEVEANHPQKKHTVFLKPCQRILCASVNVCRPYVLFSTSRSNHAGKRQNDASMHDRPCIGIKGFPLTEHGRHMCTLA